MLSFGVTEAKTPFLKKEKIMTDELKEGVGEFFWHIHHERLLEVATEPIENRIEFIRKNKPSHEVETRLRLLKRVIGPLPHPLLKAEKKYSEALEKYNKAREKYNEAREKYDKAREKYNEAWKECYKARKKYNDQIEELHKRECFDCPWNGKTIFP